MHVPIVIVAMFGFLYAFITYTRRGLGDAAPNASPVQYYRENFGQNAKMQCENVASVIMLCRAYVHLSNIPCSTWTKLLNKGLIRFYGSINQ